MHKLIAGSFASAARAILSFSGRQQRYTMSAAGSTSEADKKNNVDKEEADDRWRFSDSGESDFESEVPTDKSLLPSVSKTADSGSALPGSGSRDQKRKLLALGQEDDDCFISKMFSGKPPKRQFHLSPSSNADKGYRTREQVVREEKG